MTVPNVVGMTRAAAAAALTAHHCNVGTDINVPGDGVMAVGNVYAQNVTCWTKHMPNNSNSNS